MNNIWTEEGYTQNSITMAVGIFLYESVKIGLYLVLEKKVWKCIEKWYDFLALRPVAYLYKKIILVLILIFTFMNYIIGYFVNFSSPKPLMVMKRIYISNNIYFIRVRI